MSGITKRSVREAKKRQERLQWMFITKYIEGVHRNVYTEAQEFYQKVKSTNPEIKDLTKTAEFMRKVTPNVVIPRHYISRRRSHIIHLQPQTEMVLNIQLLPPSGVSTSLPSGVSTSLPSEVSTLPPPEVSTLPPPEVSTLPPPEVSTLPPPEVSTLPPPEVSTPLAPEVYEELLNELKSDPNLWNILNTFPLEENTDGINNLVAEDMGGICFLANDITPLEQELEALS